MRSRWTRGANRIYDKDGDGIEDNVPKTADELDKFRDPLVFRTAEELNNTHHGDLPGHVSREFDLAHGVEPGVHASEIAPLV